MSVVTNELDYKKETISHASYQLTKILPQSQITTITNGAEAIFEISPKVFNPAQSELQMSVTFPVVATDNAINVVFTDTVSEIRQIQLYTRTGLFLADVMYANNYVKAVSRYETPYYETMTNDRLVGGATAPPQQWEGLFACGATATVRPTEASTANGSPAEAYLETNYVTESATGGTAGAGNAITIKYAFPLKIFKHTIFDLNKDLYFGGETLYLRVVFDAPNRYGYSRVSNTPTNFDNVSNVISNLQLLLAVEQNPVIQNELKNKVMSPEGFTTIVPMMYYNKISSTAGSSYSVQTRYNRGHGSKIKKIYTAPFFITESGKTTFSLNNSTYTKANTFRTSINNIRTTQYDYQCENGDDWNIVKKKLKGSSYLSSSDYYYTWVWCDDFTNNYNVQMEDALLKTDADNIIDGIDLSQEIIYEFYNYRSGGNLEAVNYYTFAQTIKDLTVNSSGITLN